MQLRLSQCRCLAIGNLVSFEMGGLDDDEQLVAIDFDFGHLFAIEGIFYRQWMQIEHRLEACRFHRLSGRQCRSRQIRRRSLGTGRRQGSFSLRSPSR